MQRETPCNATPRRQIAGYAVFVFQPTECASSGSFVEIPATFETSIDEVVRHVGHRRRAQPDEEIRVGYTLATLH